MKKRLKLTKIEALASDQLGPYYFDFSEVLNPNWPFDSVGVRLRPYSPPLFFQYHPMAIAEYALENHRLFLSTGKNYYKEEFLKNAEWFVQNQTIVDSKFGIWAYGFRDTFAYHTASDIYRFWSSMSQGYGISLLLRAYEITKDEAFLQSAYYALKSYEYDVREGGIRTIYNNYVFFEEAPTVPPSCILNGFIFSLVGLYDFIKFRKDKKAESLFNEGIRTLDKCLLYYDTSYWSRYHLQYPRYLASAYYHDVHIVQLKFLYRITNNQVFLHYSSKWDSYRKNIRCFLKFIFTFYFYRSVYKIERISTFLKSL